MSSTKKQSTLKKQKLKLNEPTRLTTEPGDLTQEKNVSSHGESQAEDDHDYIESQLDLINLKHADTVLLNEKEDGLNTVVLHSAHKPENLDEKFQNIEESLRMNPSNSKMKIEVEAINKHFSES